MIILPFSVVEVIHIPNKLRSFCVLLNFVFGEVLGSLVTVM